MTFLTKPVLVLNKLWTPIRVITVKRAFKLVFSERASIVLPDDYSVYNWEEWSKIAVPATEDGIQTTRNRIKIPEVIVLLRYDKIHQKGVRLTKKNIFLRDKYICQYTGKQMKGSEADIDHVVPKSKGGKSTWDNLVVCSKEINRLKRDRTPEEAGLTLIKQPAKPSYEKLMVDPKMDIPESWRKFIGHLVK